MKIKANLKIINNSGFLLPYLIILISVILNFVFNTSEENFHMIFYQNISSILNNIKSGDSITCADMILDYPLIVDMDKIKVNILKDELNIFNDHIFKIKSTIGHTNDSITIYDDNNLFCGDLIFDGGGIGRTDLPTGDYGDIIVSIDWLNTLDKNMIVHSGHGNDFQLKDFFENFDF